MKYGLEDLDGQQNHVPYLVLLTVNISPDVYQCLNVFIYERINP